MLGVWMAPVTAQLMMTLAMSVSLSCDNNGWSLPQARPWDQCRGYRRGTRGSTLSPNRRIDASASTKGMSLKLTWTEAMSNPPTWSL